MMLLKGMAWLGSMAGYVGFFAEAGPRWAAPLTAACSVSLILYAAGLAGLLQPCAWLLLVCGLCLLIRLLLQKKLGRLFPEFCLMSAAGALLWLRYRSALLVAYDDFSHWGMIVQRMLTTHAFPVAEDSLIVFQSYPPGAACWLYDAGLFWGNGDGLLLTAQGWLVLAGIWPLFGAAEGKYAWGRRIGMAGVLLVFLSLYQGTASLMVDNLLPAVAVGALSTGLLLQRQKEERGLWMVGIQLAQLCMIKDSGLFFAAAVLVLLLAARHLKGRKTSLKDGIALLLPALAARCLWLLHIKLAFPAVGVSRHALTLENLRRTGGQKSFEEMLSIGKSLLERMLSPDNLVLQMIAFSLMIGLFEAFRRKAGKKEKRQAWPAALGGGRNSFDLRSGPVGDVYFFHAGQRRRKPCGVRTLQQQLRAVFVRHYGPVADGKTLGGQRMDGCFGSGAVRGAADSCMALRGAEAISGKLSCAPALYNGRIARRTAPSAGRGSCFIGGRGRIRQLCVLYGPVRFSIPGYSSGTKRFGKSECGHL